MTEAARTIRARLKTYAELQNERPAEPMAIPSLAIEAADVIDQLSEAEAIVRTLTNFEPLVEKGESAIHGEWEECGTCGGRNASVGEPVDHWPVCPWRRAVEWVAAHPEDQ